MLKKDKIEFWEYDLGNGLHVILHQDNTYPLVSINIWYHVGAKDEDLNRSGFAHLFEHMMFQGSKNIGKADHFKYIQNAGGYLNATTNQDRTNYFETVPSNQLETVLWLESDRMMHLNVTEENFNNQRDVVKEEKRQRYDNRPYGQWLIKLFNNSFADHPYHEATIGKMEDLDAADVTYAQNFHNKYYAPNNAVLVITGDIVFKEVTELVQSYFGDIPRSDTKKKYFPIPTYNTGQIIENIYDNINVPALYLAYKSPQIKHEDIYAINLVAAILGDGKSSRLYKSIVYEKKLAKNISSFLFELEIGSLMLINSMSLITKEPEIALNKILEEIDDEIEKIKVNVTEKEIQKAKNTYEAEFVSSLQTTLGIAEALAHYWTFYRKTDLINSDIMNYLKLTKEDLLATANKYLNRENRIILKFLPKESKP